MSNTNLDTTYAQLVDQFQALNTKLDAFINGDDTVTIAIGNGTTIKSLAGIVKDLNTIRFIQKIVDHRLYADMTADTSIVEGQLVRIWGETDSSLLGIYKLQNGTFSKISYADLYDLTHV